MASSADQDLRDSFAAKNRPRRTRKVTTANRRPIFPIRVATPLSFTWETDSTKKKGVRKNLAQWEPKYVTNQILKESLIVILSCEILRRKYSFLLHNHLSNMVTHPWLSGDFFAFTWLSCNLHTELVQTQTYKFQSNHNTSYLHPLISPGTEVKWCWGTDTKRNRRKYSLVFTRLSSSKPFVSVNEPFSVTLINIFK